METNRDSHSFEQLYYYEVGKQFQNFKTDVSSFLCKKSGKRFYQMKLFENKLEWYKNFYKSEKKKIRIRLQNINTRKNRAKMLLKEESILEPEDISYVKTLEKNNYKMELHFKSHPISFSKLKKSADEILKIERQNMIQKKRIKKLYALLCSDSDFPYGSFKNNHISHDVESFHQKSFHEIHCPGSKSIEKTMNIDELFSKSTCPLENEIEITKNKILKLCLSLRNRQFLLHHENKKILYQKSKLLELQHMVYKEVEEKEKRVKNLRDMIEERIQLKNLINIKTEEILNLTVNLSQSTFDHDDAIREKEDYDEKIRIIQQNRLENNVNKSLLKEKLNKINEREEKFIKRWKLLKEGIKTISEREKEIDEYEHYIENLEMELKAKGKLFEETLGHSKEQLDAISINDDAICSDPILETLEQRLSSILSQYN